ncbi:hypothetical protein FTW19_17345 [Terriglobus albidus]|uniref:Uncharacterized protein n=1 Tax=Terriglobus albidus TaxID=1592106 RepID=A0A5B9ED14_9BACT|nr:hypothetical protein FTW19_17345 [Terriglobus albidus]
MPMETIPQRAQSTIPTTNRHLIRWVEMLADLCRPSAIHWVDGSHVDQAAWRKEVTDHEELFLPLHDHLPPEMIYERELLICRL